MVVAALIISIAALLLSGFVALAVMEVVAERPAGPRQPAEDSIEEFELSPAVAGTSASSHGLPDRIDGASTHLVLVISPRCSMCKKLALSFDGKIPAHLTVVVAATDAVRMRKWAAESGLSLRRTVFDDDMAIVNGLEVSSSPTVVGFVNGTVAFVAGVGGRRALDDLLEQRIAILEQVPSVDAPEETDAAVSDTGDGSRGSRTRGP